MEGPERGGEGGAGAWERGEVKVATSHLHLETNGKQASPLRSHSGICGICFGTNRPLPDSFPRELLLDEEECTSEAEREGRELVVCQCVR